MIGHKMATPGVMGTEEVVAHPENKNLVVTRMRNFPTQKLSFNDSLKKK